MAELSPDFEKFLWTRARDAYLDAQNGASDSTIIEIAEIEGVSWTVAVEAHSLKEGDKKPVILTPYGGLNLASRLQDGMSQTGFPERRRKQYEAIQRMPRAIWSIALGATAIDTDFLRSVSDVCRAKELVYFGDVVVPGRILPGSSVLNQCSIAPAHFTLRGAVRAYSEKTPVTAIITPNAISATPHERKERVIRRLIKYVMSEEGPTIFLCQDDGVPESLVSTNIDVANLDEQRSVYVNGNPDSEGEWPAFSQLDYHGPNSSHLNEYLVALDHAKHSSMPKSQVLEYLHSQIE